MSDDLNFVKIRTTSSVSVIEGADDVYHFIANLTEGLPRALRWNMGRAVRLTLTVEVADAQP